MKGSSDSNDVLPKAIIYFYPPNPEIRADKEIDCGGTVGAVQYFQHDLFRSIARTLHFQRSFVAHEHYGRHSGFLSVPDDRYSPDEAHIYLKHILNIFNMLYGTWNHIQTTYTNENELEQFLHNSLTPIVDYVLSQHRSISTLFSTIDYSLLKKGNERILLESKHYLGYLKTKYGLRDGFIGYKEQILHSTCDPDTTYYLQLLFQLTNELSNNLTPALWDTKFKLRTGVYIYRIYIRQPLIPPPTRKPLTIAPSNANIPTLKITKATKDIFDGFTSPGEDSPGPSYNPSHRLSVPSTIKKNHLGMTIRTDPSGSSEETGFDTDTGDESSPRFNTNIMTTSISSGFENMKDFTTEDSDSSLSPSGDEKPKTDEDKIKEKSQIESRSRSSTASDKELEKTVKIDQPTDSGDGFHRIQLVQVDSFDTSDEEQQPIPIHTRISSDHSRERSKTVTSDFNLKESNDRCEFQVTWTDIPDKNIEDERDELVLYIQNNSFMMFVGIFEKSLLTDEYLNKLWNLTLLNLSDIDSKIQAISTTNDMIRLTNEVTFPFNENTRHAKFERTFDGIRYSRRIPSEESTYMALMARTELNRNPERKVIGLSRGSHFVSIDRRFPDRILYSCRRYQETL